MAIKLQDNPVLTVGEADLCAILTDHFCGGYTPFGDMMVTNVSENAGNFTVQFERRPDECEA